MQQGHRTLTGGDAAEEALLYSQPPGHDHRVVAGHLGRRERGGEEGVGWAAHTGCRQRAGKGAGSMAGRAMAIFCSGSFILWSPLLRNPLL